MQLSLAPDMLATDIADYLVRKGVPFRETHHIAGAVVKRAEELGTEIDKLSLKELRSIYNGFDEDVEQVFDFEKSVERRSAKGGTSRSSVMEQVQAIRTILEQ
jgi:argininosuccinate lyase